MGDYKAILETTTTRLEIHKSQPTTQQQTTVPLTENPLIYIPSCEAFCFEKMRTADEKNISGLLA